jgi:epoxyqueuosine reductase
LDFAAGGALILAGSGALTETIKEKALELGFDLVGVTTPAAAETYPAYTRWLEAGRHGEMGYLDGERARQCRADPGRLMQGCRSILVLGARYANPDRGLLAQEPGAPAGRTAAYAWGDDYHLVLKKRMAALHAAIEAAAGRPVASRAYTDTGPLLERDLAQRAGLGWIGKNTCLIRPGFGSYFFLAEMLLDLELEPDAPFTADHCGSCTRCITACPTDCILPDRTLDARRCISYLTIELKGALPDDLRSKVGEWVFGCDICQQVCPWNVRFAAPGSDPAFEPRAGLPRPDLRSELALSAQEYAQKFKGSPVKRAKRGGYLRNVTVAAGNSGDRRLIPALVKNLQSDPEPLVRGHAAWALGRFNGREARQALAAAYEAEQDEEVRGEIKAALGMRPGD